MTSTPAPEPELLITQDGPVVTVTFNRPQARNAMTWAMYEGLAGVCERVDADSSIRVLVLRGAGDRAFVAGTDISQFTAFTTAQDALDYEARLDRIIGRLETVTKPTLALIRGYAVGAGANMALACDLRLATPSAQFGIPIARTLGNCLSMATYTRLVATIGPSLTKDLLFTARLAGAEEARAIGLYREIVPDDALEARGRELANELAERAPLTLWATKEALRRLREGNRDGRDIISRVYTSDDFHEGVDAFLTKRPPAWRGH